MKKRFGGILGALLILLVMGMTVCAADAGDIKKNTVLQTNSEVELHEAPDASSAVTATLPSGTPVIIKEDAADGWCKAAYKEDEGYVQTSCLVGLGSQSTPAADETQPADGDEAAKGDDAVPENGNALDDEFKTIEEAAIVAYQEAETAKDQAASEKVWGIVIAVLVVAIFAVGIITTVRNNKGKK